MLDARERVHGLGIFKALGMSPKQTIIMVITSVAGIGLLAGAIGTRSASPCTTPRCRADVSLIVADNHGARAGRIRAGMAQASAVRDALLNSFEEAFAGVNSVDDFPDLSNSGAHFGFGGERR